MVRMDSSMNIVLNAIPVLEGTLIETHRGSYLCDHGIGLEDFGSALCPSGPGINHWCDDGIDSIDAMRTRESITIEYESIGGYLQWWTGMVNGGYLKPPFAHPTRMLQNR